MQKLHSLSLTHTHSSVFVYVTTAAILLVLLYAWLTLVLQMLIRQNEAATKIQAVYRAHYARQQIVSPTQV